MNTKTNKYEKAQTYFESIIAHGYEFWVSPTDSNLLDKLMGAWIRGRDWVMVGGKRTKSKLEESKIDTEQKIRWEWRCTYICGGEIISVAKWWLRDRTTATSIIHSR